MCPRCKKRAPLIKGQYKIGRKLFPCCQTCVDALVAHRAEMKAWRAKNAKKHRAWSKRWAENNREKVNAWNRNPEHRKKWYVWHNEYRRKRKTIRAAEARTYRAKYPEACRKRKRQYYANNAEKIRKHSAAWIKANPWLNRIAASLRRAAKLQRTPTWANQKEIAKIYRNCPPEKVVDHVIPLRGKIVSGLHVHNNLQYLKPRENGVKGNKFEAA